MITLTWQEFKNLITQGIRFREVDSEIHCKLFASDGSLIFTCLVDKNSVDEQEYIASFKNKKLASVNTDSDGLPIFRARAFANTDGFRFRGLGKVWTANKNSNTNLDFVVPEERFINGIKLILKNQQFGDEVTFQILAPNDFILDEFATNWSLDELQQDQILIPYPARILTGLKIRIIYKSVGTVNDVTVRANFFLHKKAE